AGRAGHRRPHGGEARVRRDGAPRARPRRGGGAADRERGGGGRHVREPGRARATLLPGEARAGNGAAGVVGVCRAGRDAAGRRACRDRRRRVRPAGGVGRSVSPALLPTTRLRGTAVTFFLISSMVKILAVFTAIMVGVALLTLAERRICAWMQDRLGPNRVGPQGLLQPAADGLKNLVKEETLPARADKVLFMLAPAMSFIPALLTFAVIPFATPLPTPWGDVEMVVANLPVGFLYILAFGSLGVYGIVLAGWSSNNKYSLLGGLRASAQMISYEIALGMSTVAVLLLAGNVTLTDVIAKQSTSLFTWNVFPLSLAFFLFLYIWVRWTLPRFRYDQLMALGWKVMLPLALGYLTVIATAIWILHGLLGWNYDRQFGLALFGLNVLLALPLLFLLDRGHLVAG